MNGGGKRTDGEKLNVLLNGCVGKFGGCRIASFSWLLLNALLNDRERADETGQLQFRLLLEEWEFRLPTALSSSLFCNWWLVRFFHRPCCTHTFCILLHSSVVVVLPLPPKFLHTFRSTTTHTISRSTH